MYPDIKKAFVLSHAEHGKAENGKVEFVPLYYAHYLASTAKLKSNT
jgi:hypothetical protein